MLKPTALVLSLLMVSALAGAFPPAELHGVTPAMAPQSTLGSSHPVSQHYVPYQKVQPSSQEQQVQAVKTGSAGLSFGVYNGTLAITITQGNRQLYSGSITGPAFNYVVVGGSSSYGYVNFASDGSTVVFTLLNTGATVALFAWNLYNASITDHTASMITYPPQFAANIAPSESSILGTYTPQNTGVSFILTAPKYSQPTPLAIWVGEGYADSSKNWWYQLGLTADWDRSNSVSYPFTEAFSNIFGNPPTSNDFNYPLVPGDRYNFTMAVVSGTTWAFLVNGTAIANPEFSGRFNTTTSYANYDADLGLETITASGAGINITDTINIPMMMAFKIDGRWAQPAAIELGPGGVGENWWNGNTSSAPGMAVWGVEGNLQNASVKTGSLIFGDSLSPLLTLQDSRLAEPLSGTYVLPNAHSSFGSGIVSASTNGSRVTVTPEGGPTYVSLVYLDSGNHILQDVPVVLSAQGSFPALKSAASVYVYATTDYAKFQGVYLLLAQPQTTTTITVTTFQTTTTTRTVTNTTTTTATTTLPVTTTATVTSSTTSTSTLPVTTTQTTTTTTTVTSTTTAPAEIPEALYTVSLPVAAAIAVIGAALLLRMKKR